MYRMPEFTEKDLNEIVSFIREHPFAMVVANGSNGCAATQVPLLVSSQGGQLKLRGHVMRKTDHHKALEQSQDVLLLFTGPQCYVSASWYSERGHGSTWNYMTVQATGTVALMNEDETVQLLTDLTHHFENGQEQPELVEHMSDDYIRSNVKAIAGFEITVKDLKATFKLSQNRDDESYVKIVKQLRQSEQAGVEAVAREMIKRRPQLF